MVDSPSVSNGQWNLMTQTNMKQKSGCLKTLSFQNLIEQKAKFKLQESFTQFRYFQWVEASELSHRRRLLEVGAEG